MLIAQREQDEKHTCPWRQHTVEFPCVLELTCSGTCVKHKMSAPGVRRYSPVFAGIRLRVFAQDPAQQPAVGLDARKTPTSLHQAKSGQSTACLVGGGRGGAEFDTPRSTVAEFQRIFRCSGAAFGPRGGPTREAGSISKL